MRTDTWAETIAALVASFIMAVVGIQVLVEAVRSFLKVQGNPEFMVCRRSRVRGDAWRVQVQSEPRARIDNQALMVRQG